MPTNRVGCRAASVNGKIYIIGSYYESTNPMDEYDPVSNSWLAKGIIPTGRYGFGIAVWNEQIYVIGGRNQADLSHNYPCPETEAYTPPQ